MLDHLLKYAIVVVLAFITIVAPDLYALVSGVHIDRTITFIVGLAVTYAAWFWIKPRPFS